MQKNIKLSDIVPEENKEKLKGFEKRFEQELGPGIAIDECNLKIKEYNGDLEKEADIIRKKFSVPKLLEKDDEYNLNYHFLRISNSYYHFCLIYKHPNFL